MTSARAEIRPAVAADAEALARIYGEGIAERVATFETKPPTAAELSDRLASGSIYLVAERDGAVVGFAKTGSYSDPAPYYRGVAEATVYVSSEARRGGVGSALIAALAADAERRGQYKLIAKIFSTNQRSVAMFAAQGWREVGVHRRHGRLDGEWKDVVLMELLLGDARS